MPAPAHSSAKAELPDSYVAEVVVYYNGQAFDETCLVNGSLLSLMPRPDKYEVSKCRFVYQVAKRATRFYGYRPPDVSKRYEPACYAYAHVVCTTHLGTATPCPCEFSLRRIKIADESECVDLTDAGTDAHNEANDAAAARMGFQAPPRTPKRVQADPPECPPAPKKTPGPGRSKQADKQAAEGARSDVPAEGAGAPAVSEGYSTPPPSPGYVPGL